MRTLVCFVALCLSSHSPLAFSQDKSWAMQLSPFVGRGHSNVGEKSQSASGAALTMQREYWRTDSLSFAPVLGVHNLNSYFKSRENEMNTSSNARHINALIGVQVASRRQISSWKLTPFTELNLGYGRSQIKLTDNSETTYNEYSYNKVNSSLLKISLGTLIAVNHHISMSLAYNWLQQRYSLASEPDSSFQELYVVGSGLSLNTVPSAEQNSVKTYQGSNIESIHALQVGLVVKL